MAIGEDGIHKGDERRPQQVDHEMEIKGILEIIEKIDYGSVTVIIQEGKITQIERDEKVRIK